MKRKILVLEDEENIRSFLVLNLKRSGYEVIEAETGEIALEKYHENQDIAVAVLDVMLRCTAVCPVRRSPRMT